MKNKQILKTVYSALFAALIFTGTEFLRIPLPFGYFNFGDCLVLLSAFIIKGPYAIAASAIGSVMADILSGYTVYVPATLIIKSLMVIIFNAILKLISHKNEKPKTLFLIFGIVLSEFLMILGYFICDVFIYSFEGAATSIMGNIVQGIVATIVSLILIKLLERSNISKHFKL